MDITWMFPKNTCPNYAPEMLFGQFLHHASESPQPELLGHLGRSQEPRVQLERAQGVGELAAVQLQQGRNAETNQWHTFATLHQNCLSCSYL